MKYIYILFLTCLVANGQTTNSSLNLLPWPQSVVQNNDSFALTKSFKINITGNPDDRIFLGATNFLRRLDGRTGLFFQQGFSTKRDEFPLAELQINCSKKGNIAIYEDESYQLSIDQKSIKIDASSDLGALHALETLLQLLQNDGKNFYFPSVTINDAPRFTWRGLMIDAARHFQPVDVIKRNLDAMAAVKMNVFHWHLVDDQGWRIEMKTLPKLHELASDGLYYTQDEIKGIVKYAADRGILVVPEIDVPGHGSAILTAYPEIGSKVAYNNKKSVEDKLLEMGVSSYSIERNAGIFTPTLDPSNPKTYELLSTILDEVCPLFPGKFFHIGGDENEGKDWDANPIIQEFKKKHQINNNHELQTYFTMQLVPMLKKHNKDLMGWEEIRTSKMSKDAIIHSWKGINEGVPAGKSLVDAVKNGYKTVLSNGYYIDLMYGVEDHYSVDPMPKNVVLTTEEKERILGGEATMWSELVTPMTIDSRLWPRTAAIAERLWSDEKITDIDNLRSRLNVVSFRLEELGLTHLKNKEVLLRNITNNQNTVAVNDFSNICEPLKKYSRNAGGIEYQMYSPLSLFADACTADASDALLFKALVDDYCQNKKPETKKMINEFFLKWIKTNLDLLELSKNAPLIHPILPLAQNVSDVSKLFVQRWNGQEIDKKELEIVLDRCNSKEHADVEIAVYSSLKKLL